VPWSRASNAKFEPTVLLALFPIHSPTVGPSTSYLVPNGILFSPLVRNAWVVLMTASCTETDDALAATMFQSEL